MPAHQANRRDLSERIDIYRMNIGQQVATVMPATGGLVTDGADRR
jgi:hypothetical protein